MGRERVASAIWWNWANSIMLAALLTVIGMGLAYIVGWAADVYVANDLAPSGRGPCHAQWNGFPSR